MSTFLAILILLVAVLLVLIVVIQNSKGGGLAAGFDSSNRYMGVRKTTDFLERATWWFAGSLVALSIISSHFMQSKHTSETELKQKEIQKSAPILNKQDIPATLPGTAAPAEKEAANTEAPAEPQENTPATPAK